MPLLQPVPAVRVPARTRTRTLASALPVAAVLVALVTLAGCGSVAVASTPSPPVAASPTSPATPASHRSPERPGPVTAAPRAATGRALGVADGRVPDGATVFDDTLPAVARLDPRLLRALRRAATDAGTDFRVNSGWRSPAYQEQLLDEAVARYGSRAAAARWVATPATSPHVSGDAVDLAGSDAITWLARHGDGYGLCQVFRNEPWHYELHPEAVEDGCPAQYADPSHDPRMQR
jgi:zinc D-Ala-D-Ala carboxypeptidase